MLQLDGGIEARISASVDGAARRLRVLSTPDTQNRFDHSPTNAGTGAVGSAAGSEPTVGLAVAALVGNASPPSDDTTVVGAASFACSGEDSSPPQLAANASSALTTTMLNRVVLMLHSMNDRQPRARGSFPDPHSPDQRSPQLVLGCDEGLVAGCHQAVALDHRWVDHVGQRQPHAVTAGEGRGDLVDHPLT